MLGRRAYLRVWGVAAVLFLALGVGDGMGVKAGEPSRHAAAAGIIGNRVAVAVVTEEEAAGASYLPASNVLRLADGRLRYVPPGSSETVTVRSGDPGAGRSAAESRAWLVAGRVPGESMAERGMAERALLDLRLLTRPNGAALAAPRKGWAYVWPRDASWVAAAFAATGHHREAYRVLGFLAKVQRDDGLWEARYKASGAPVLDGREPQLDAAGWFPWAVWFCVETDPDPARARREAEALWPAVRAAADAAEGSLGSSGLPPGGPDYWESATWRPNLGTAAPLRTGLRSAADTARRLGHEAAARRYSAAAGRLDLAIEESFAPHGYPRTTRPGSGADAAVNFLAPPFASRDPEVERAMDAAAARLRVPNGGVVPGEGWPWRTAAWTPETAFFALSAAASGDGEGAERWLGWLAAHRTSLGAFSEKVGPGGKARSAVPLTWTGAAVLLALVAEEEPLPVPPASPAG